LTERSKKYASKTANMAVCGQKVYHQMDELQRNKFEELERKCCGKLTEHHEWLTDLERRNESTVQEIKAQKLNVGRLEENLDGTNQNMQGQFQSGMAGFAQHFLPSIHARIERLVIDTPSSQLEQI